MKIGLIGGDIRYKYLVESLNNEVAVFGNYEIYDENHPLYERDVENLLLTHKLIIVPIPFSKDNRTIYMKGYEAPLLIDGFIDLLTSEHILIGGPFNKEMRDKIKIVGTKIIDITSIESFKRDNSIPTAEGVIGKIIERTNYTIFDSKALVLGYGYCGKRIAYLLKHFGAKVSVYTKSKAEEHDAIKMGFNIYSEVVKPSEYIINTIPVKTLDVNQIDKNLFIDITDAYEIIDDIGVKMRGIPGRVSPLYAGHIIAKTIGEIINNIDMEE